MGEDIFLLDIPNFNPVYEPNIYYSYSNEKGKENLKKLLTSESKGYCMYCYTKILVDRKNFGQLEHTIEKSNSDSLKNCIVNLSIACSKCNQSFKKKGEADRKLTDDELQAFETSLNCKDGCTNICDNYKRLRSIYLRKQNAKIILQPFGVKNVKTGNEYLIQYDLLNQKFIPSKKYKYTEIEKHFINQHIRRFNLNDSKFRTKEVIKFCEDVMEYGKIPKEGRYLNLMVDLFIKKLKEVQKDKVVAICKIIYNQAFIKYKN